MTSEVFSFLKQCFALFWKLFTGWIVPGTNVTVGAWILFALSAGVLFRFLAKFGFGRASLDDVKRLHSSSSGGSDKKAGGAK